MANFQSAIPYIQKAEGGLSRATSDSASANPSPYVYKGQTGWHTNRGITWGTFKDLSPKLGYEISEQNFIYMPDDVWYKIYKGGFWDAVKGDLYQSQAIANAVVDFAWAAGTGGSKKSLIKFLKSKDVTADGPQTIAEGFNKLVEKEGENKVFNDLIDHRKAFFKSLNQPANEKGWLARMESLRKQGLDIISKGAKEVVETAKKGVETVKQNPITSALVTLALIVSAYVLYSQLKRKNK